MIVVTAQGVADRRTLNDPERVEAILGVAHPEWRAPRAARARTLPSMRGVGVMPAQPIELNDGRTAIVRPAGRHDNAAIGEYITRLDSDDRRTRWMGTVSVHALTTADRPAQLYRASLDYLLHAALIVDLEGEIIGRSSASPTPSARATRAPAAKRSRSRAAATCAARASAGT